MRLFFVVGHSGIGKSSTIRALTGIGRFPTLSCAPPIKGFLANIDFTNGTRKAYVLGLALQEAQISRYDFWTAVNSFGVNEAFVALRYYDCQLLGTAQDYVDYFKQQGAQIDHALLSTNLPLLHGSPGIRIPTNGPALAPPSPNGVAHALRHRWQLL